MQATLYNSMFKLPHLFNLYFSAISITYLLTDHRELFFGQKGAFFYHSTHKVLIMANQEGNCSGNTHKKIVFFLALYHAQKGKSLKESRKGLNSLSLVHTFIFVSTHSLPLDSVFDLFTISLIFFLFLLCCHLASGFPLASLNGFSSSPPFSQLTMNSSLSPQSLASSLTHSQMLFKQLSYVSFA